MKKEKKSTKTTQKAKGVIEIGPVVLVVGGRESERLAMASQLCYPAFKIDTLIIKPDRTIKIDQIRQLGAFVHLSAYGRHGKRAIIAEAQTMTIEAQNAALKTLEEPPQGTKLILTSPSEELLLPTIVSRCQLLRLGPLAPSLSESEATLALTPLSQALAGGIPACFKLAEAKATSRQEALEWLEQLELACSQRLASPQAEKKGVKLAQVLRLLQKAKQVLQANANVKLGLEVFLLRLLELRYNRSQ